MRALDSMLTVGVAGIIAVGGWLYVTRGSVLPFRWSGGGRAAACAIDVNGDGTFDPIGRTDGVMGTGVRAIDGASGRTLWFEKSSAGAIEDVYCAGPSSVMLTLPSSRIEMHEAMTGKKMWERTLSADIEELLEGGHSARLALADKTAKVLDYATGNLMDARPRPPSWQSGSSELDRQLHGEGTRFGSLLVTALEAPGTRATAFAAVHADGKAPAWSVSTKVTRGVEGVSIGRNEAGVFVAGHRAGSDGNVDYAFVRAEDGKLLYDVELESGGPAAVMHDLYFTPKIAFLHWQHALTAVDVATGAVLWETGARR